MFSVMLVIVNMFTPYGSKFDCRGSIFPIVSVKNTLYTANELSDTETLHFIFTFAEINNNLKLKFQNWKPSWSQKKLRLCL